MSPSKFALLPGAERDELTRLLGAMRPGDGMSAPGWVVARKAALAQLRDVSTGLDEYQALRLDRLIRTGARSTLSPLVPALYADLRARMGAYLDDVLDELAVRPNLHALVARAA